MRNKVPQTCDRAEFDQYSGSYNTEVNRALGFSPLKVDFFTKVKGEYLLDLIDSGDRVAGEAAFLDVGCGVGHIHSLLKDKVRRLTGIDVSKECIGVARQRLPEVDYRTYDGIHIPYPDAAFDGAFTICVLHHVPVLQRSALIQEMRRILKPGGLIAVFEHNPRNPLTRRVVSRCEFDKNAVLLRRQECEGLLSQAGFSRVVSRYILTVPAVNSSLRKLDRAFARLPFGAQYYTVGYR